MEPTVQGKGHENLHVVRSEGCALFQSSVQRERKSNSDSQRALFDTILLFRLHFCV